MHKNFTVAIQNMLRNAAAVKDWKTSGNSSCDINKRLINGKIRLWTYPRARETWMSVWNKNCYFGSQLHLIFWISNEKSWTWNCNICSLSISQPASQTMEEKEETQTPPPPKCMGGKTCRLQIGSFCFQALIQERNWFYLSFGNDPPEAAWRAQTCCSTLQKQPFVFEKNFLSFQKWLWN